MKVRHPWKNQQRRYRIDGLCLRASRIENTMAAYIHPSAEVADDAVVGDNTKIWHLVQLRPGAQIGSECIFGRGVFVDTHVVTGNRVKVQNYVSIYDGVTIEDGVFVGPRVVFTNDKQPRAINPDGSLKGGSDWTISYTRIREGASLGANSTIVCGITVSRWTLVGAGAVVTKNVPDYGLVVGNPARLIGYVFSHGRRIPEGADPTTYQCQCDERGK
jgi:UDP-2-acetamido-3-amino-2,3-dideoxy-glucuronate N-acetyltransferase